MPTMASLEGFKLKVRARSKGFYGGQLRYPTWTDEIPSGDPRQGAPFMIGVDALKFDKDGRLLVDGDNRPVLPRWIEALDPVDPVDPEKIECAVVENKKLQEYYRLPLRGQPPKAAAAKPPEDPAAAPAKKPAEKPATKGAKGKGEKPAKAEKPATAAKGKRPSDEQKI